MQEVNISELKARLSHYLRLVESGEEVIVKERNRPIARLTGCIRHAGAITRLEEPRRLSREEAQRLFAELPRPKLPRRVVEDTLRWMREDRTERWLRKP